MESIKALGMQHKTMAPSIRFARCRFSPTPALIRETLPLAVLLLRSFHLQAAAVPCPFLSATHLFRDFGSGSEARGFKAERGFEAFRLGLLTQHMHARTIKHTCVFDCLVTLLFRIVTLLLRLL